MHTPCPSVVADRSTLDFRMDPARRPILLGRGLTAIVNSFLNFSPALSEELIPVCGP